VGFAISSPSRDYALARDFIEKQSVEVTQRLANKFESLQVEEPLEAFLKKLPLSLSGQDEKISMTQYMRLRDHKI
jgi:hypothetical protein